MKLGAEPKKIAFLAGLLLVAGYFYISGSSNDDAPAPAPKANAPKQEARRFVPTVPSPNIERATPPAGRSRRTNSTREFRPRQGGVGALDPTTADPTLRLDLLAKVQDVKMEGGARNLFQFGQPPAPKVPEVKIATRPVMPTPTPTIPTGLANNIQPPKPQAPPITLKFYGYVSKSRTDKRAFFLDGEEIFVAGEGEMIKKRYKVVRIGVNSAVVEDTQFSNQQTLPLEEQAG